MSIRHEFSYWLTVEPKEGKLPNDNEYAAISSMLRNAEIITPDGGLVLSINNGKLHGEVNPDWGTIQEDTDIEPAVRKTAAAWPDYVFTLNELDEEDKSVQRYYVYKDGACDAERSARIVCADTDYDEQTLRGVADWLEEQEYFAAAIAMRKKFLP